MAILKNGHSTLISFAADTSVLFEEKSVTPPGVDGGDAIDTTTMLNTAYRTKSAKKLIDITDASATVAYDPLVYTEILALVNIETAVTITFPDGETCVFYGYLKSFTPGELGGDTEQPTAEIVIVATNVNDSGVETAPVVSAGGGS